MAEAAALAFAARTASLLSLQNPNYLRACLDPIDWKPYIKSVFHFIIRLLSNFSQFLGAKHGLTDNNFRSGDALQLWWAITLLITLQQRIVMLLLIFVSQ